MERILAGKSLNRIVPFGGLIAGHPLWFELWITGGVVEIRDEETISIIQRASKYAIKHGHNTCSYVRYVLMNGEE